MTTSRLRKDTTTSSNSGVNRLDPGLKEKGLLRLEGKEYLVTDGDVMHFRFAPTQ